MTDWTWTVRDRNVVGVTTVDPDPMVTLEWGPAAFPWGEPAFPTFLLLGISAPATNPARPVRLFITQTMAVTGALERSWPGPAVVTSTGNERIEMAIGLPGASLPDVFPAPLPLGIRLMSDPAGAVAGVLILNFAAAFPPTGLGPVMIWGRLE